MTNFQLEEFARRGGKLLEETQKNFETYKDLNIGLDKISLPKTMKPSDGAVKLVFVGQYSSGKSSIIKMLTGIETEIGAGIKTQTAHTYNWGDLEIVDTPGIHTELRPDHDEKTYYEIDHAALLIFVVTNEGFDDRMGNHFRKLAITQDRGKNMVLVVNKMDRTALGNVPEQQEIIEKDLLKVIEPFTPAQLYLTFLNTEYYFEWQTETDEELKEIYLNQSGYEKFVNNLNSFVSSRGVLSKIQSPLETLKSTITSVIGESEDLSIDRDIEAAEQLLIRRQKTLLDGKRRIRAEITEIAETLCSKIKSEGSKLAGEIAPGITEENFKRKLEAAQLQVDTYVNSYEKRIFDRLAEICDNVNQEMALIDKSQFSVNVQTNFSAPVHVPSEDERAAKMAWDIKSKSGIWENIGMTSKDAASATIPLLGGKLSSVVKDVGHFFGFKFAPWGAVNVVKSVSNVLGWIGLAMTAYQILCKFFGEDEQKKMEEELRKAREETQNSFNNIAEDIREEIISAATNKMDELTAPAFADADNKISEFRRMKQRLKELGHSLQNTLIDVQKLMDEVQQTAGT